LFLYKPSAPIEKLNRSGSGPGDGNDNTPALLADVDAAALDDLLAFLKKYVSLFSVSLCLRLRLRLSSILGFFAPSVRVILEHSC
jgi:hypothetical protein